MPGYLHTGRIHEMTDETTSKGRKFLRLVLTKEGYQGREAFIAFDVWSDKVADRVRPMSKGDEIKVEFDLESRQGQRGWFSPSASVFKVALVRAAGAKPNDVAPSDSNEDPDSLPF